MPGLLAWEVRAKALKVPDNLGNYYPGGHT